MSLTGISFFFYFGSGQWRRVKPVCVCVCVCGGSTEVKPDIFHRVGPCVAVGEVNCGQLAKGQQAKQGFLPCLQSTERIV